MGNKEYERFSKVAGEVSVPLPFGGKIGIKIVHHRKVPREVDLYHDNAKRSTSLKPFYISPKIKGKNS